MQCIREASSLRKILKSRYPKPPPGDCPICGTYTEGWVLDHCHEREVFRGYICNRCNLGLGMFYDKSVIVMKALDYLNAST
jgi:hypothetical protein